MPQISYIRPGSAAPVAWAGRSAPVYLSPASMAKARGPEGRRRHSDNDAEWGLESTPCTKFSFDHLYLLR